VKIDLSETNPNSRGGSVTAGSKTASPARLKETMNRRKLEDYKDSLAALESDIEIYHSKKIALENELNNLMEKEKEKLLATHEFERQNHQLKTEVNMLAKDIEMLEQSKRGLENSYNDVLRELKRVQLTSRPEDRLTGTSQPTTYREAQRDTTRKTYASEKPIQYLDTNYNYKNPKPEPGSSKLDSSAHKYDSAKYDSSKNDVGSGKFDTNRTESTKYESKPESSKYDSMHLSEKYADKAKQYKTMTPSTFGKLYIGDEGNSALTNSPGSIYNKYKKSTN